MLTESGTTNQVTVQDYFEGADWQLPVDFASDTSWSASTIEGMVQGPTTLAADITTTVTTSGSTTNAVSGDTVALSGTTAGTVSISGNGTTASDDSASYVSLLEDDTDSSDNTFQSAGAGDTVIVNGSGDTVTVNGTGSSVYINNSGAIITLGGSSNTAYIASAATSGTATIGGTSDTVNIAGSSSESIVFDSDTLGTLLLQSAQNFTGTVAGLGDTDSIDLANFNFADGATISSVTGTGDEGTNTVLTISDNGVSTQIALLNQFANQFATSASAYTLAADSTQTNAGTLLQLAAGH